MRWVNVKNEQYRNVHVYAMSNMWFCLTGKDLFTTNIALQTAWLTHGHPSNHNVKCFNFIPYFIVIVEVLYIYIKIYVALKIKKMNLEARKISFIQEFLRLQNEDIVIGLEKLLRERKAELIEKEIKPMTMEEYNADIDRAMDDSKNGKMIKATDLKTKVQKWN